MSTFHLGLKVGVKIRRQAKALLFNFRNRLVSSFKFQPNTNQLAKANLNFHLPSLPQTPSIQFEKFEDKAMLDFHENKKGSIFTNLYESTEY